MFDPFRLGPYRQNYYWQKKGQIIRKRVTRNSMSPKTIPELEEWARVTNKYGITIPNPNWKSYIELPPSNPVCPPTPPPPGPEEEEEHPEPPISDGIPIFNSLQIFQSTPPSGDFDVRLAINYEEENIGTLENQLDAGQTINLFFEIPSEERFNVIVPQILIASDYDFEHGQGNYIFYAIQIINKYENLVNKPQTFPVYISAAITIDQPIKYYFTPDASQLQHSSILTTTEYDSEMIIEFGSSQYPLQVTQYGKLLPTALEELFSSPMKGTQIGIKVQVKAIALNTHGSIGDFDGKLTFNEPQA